MYSLQSNLWFVTRRREGVGVLAHIYIVPCYVFTWTCSWIYYLCISTRRSYSHTHLPRNAFFPHKSMYYVYSFKCNREWKGGGGVSSHTSILLCFFHHSMSIGCLRQSTLRQFLSPLSTFDSQWKDKNTASVLSGAGTPR